MDLTTKVRMYVSTLPTETERSYKDGEETKKWKKESFSGLVLGSGLENVIADLQFRSSKSNVATKNAKFSDFLVSYVRNEQPLKAGERVVVAEVLMNPRVNRTGEDAGLATQWSPTILGFEIVEATDADRQEIESFKKIVNL